MSDRIRIVPDCSVLIPAFFPEKLPTGFDLTPPARSIEAAIVNREVLAFAPDVLLREFIGCAFDKVRRGNVPREEALSQVYRFIQLRITYVPLNDLTDRAIELIDKHKVSPADAWYVACANYYDADYWLSHRQKDRIAERAA